jgi:hypothetical protein
MHVSQSSRVFKIQWNEQTFIPINLYHGIKTYSETVPRSFYKINVLRKPRKILQCLELEVYIVLFPFLYCGTLLWWAICQHFREPDCFCLLGILCILDMVVTEESDYSHSELSSSLWCPNAILLLVLDGSTKLSFSVLCLSAWPHVLFWVSFLWQFSFWQLALP